MIPKSTAEVQKATLDEFIKGWASWTPDGFLSTWAEGCTQQNLPFSAKSEVKTRPFVENFFPVLMSILTNFELEIHNVVHDVAGSKAVIYALSKADSPWGPYSNEHALFLWFDESGEKVTKIEELFDTTVMNTFLPKIKERAGQMKAAAAMANGANGVNVH